MSGNPNWMNNPYTFPGVPSMTPIHLKRRSESNPAGAQRPVLSSPNQTLVAPSTRASNRPSTAGSVYTGHGGSSGAVAAAKVKHPYTVLKRGKKHHAYPAEVAPYPLNYEPRILDCEALDNHVAPQPTSPSLQPHILLSDPSTHPKRVLDIGCGGGQWIVTAASLWPETTFVGLDLVAIQPDPFAMDHLNRMIAREKENRSNRRKQAASETGNMFGPRSPMQDNEERTPTHDNSIRSTSNSHNGGGSRRPRPSISSSHSGSSARIPANSIFSRIKWVHHNFLTKRLPFKDGEFDFVHIRGIAQGVPEDQWDFLLSDVARVLCPKGSVEIIEEDILFPTVIAPTLSLAPSGGSHNANAAAARSKNQAVTSRQAALTSVREQLALNKQSLFYSEENRPSAFLSSSSNSGGNDGSPTGFSPVSPYDSTPSPLEMGAPSTSNTNIYGIPASYLHYAQTVPGLGRSLPPLALINPFLHQRQMNNQSGGTTPFSQDHAVLEQLFLAVFNKRWINVQPTAILGGVLGMQVDLGGIVVSECLEIGRPGQLANEIRSKRRLSSWSHHAGRRRGSGGSKTLLDVTAGEVEDALRDKPRSDDEDSSSGEEGEWDAEDMEAPPSPPLTPRALSPTDPHPERSPSQRRKKENRSSIRWAKSKTKSQQEEKEDELIAWKKYPSLALTTGLRALFPALDNETTKAWHLQRAWENVVACKEAMWEEFLVDSANRDHEAMQKMQNSLAQQLGSSPSSSSFVGTMSALGGLGGMGSIGATPGIAFPPTMAGIPLNRGIRQAPTLLDELEWADSDMRRSERERFDILLDRYEMRIRRHCAKWYESTSIPCLLARDRKAWAAAEAELYSSDDEEIDYGEPLPDITQLQINPLNSIEESLAPSVGSSSPNTSSVPAISASSATPSIPAPWSTSRPTRTLVDDHEGHSSADEATLAEPQSPHSPHSPTGIAQPGSTPFASIAENLSSSKVPLSEVPGTQSQTSSLRVPVPVLTRLRTGVLLKMGQPAPPSEPSTSTANIASKSTGSGRGDRQTLRDRASSLGAAKSKEEIILPSRIVRAFIATKTQLT